MSNLTAYIEAAATAALQGTGTFVHEYSAGATLVANYAELPVIVYGTATTNQQRANSRVESAAATLYFADATPGPGDDAAATQATQARMGLLRQRFLAALDARPLAQVEGIKNTPMEQLYEAQLDGIGVQFTLTVPADSLVPECL